MSDKQNKTDRPSIGGQALIEGVMMNGPKGVVLSVRNEKGEIVTERQYYTHARDKYKVLGWPLIRGVVNFVESMTIGYKSLMRSAELSGQLEAEESTENMGKVDRWLNDHMGPKMFAVISTVASVIAIALAFGLFMFLPAWLVDLVDGKLLHDALADFHPFFEGIIRLVIMVVYMFAISRMKDIKRVFMYHGAEHKSICCFEKGLPLTVENVRGCRRFHPRCGTSFIFVVIIISILVSSIVVLIVPELNETSNRLWWMVCKIFVVLPVVTAISYEFIRYAGKHDNVFTKILSAPGLWMQRITTAEPADDMMEVAIASINAVLTINDDAEKPAEKPAAGSEEEPQDKPAEAPVEEQQDGAAAEQPEEAPAAPAEEAE